MKQQNITVLRKILYAVESGGQVYGRQNYSAFAGVGANTPNEKAITIGAGQWYAGEARLLLQNIQKKYPKDFSKLDTAGIAADLKKSWDRYGVSSASAKGKCIIAIISSAVGIKCQDELMETQIKEYAVSLGKMYGAMPDTAMMECINIYHQGGASALKRILAKTAKPYTAKGIYAALNTDPADPKPNQVGDYTTRQKKVYEFITKYADGGTEQKGGTTVAVRMSNCGHDENGRYAGGKAGDQTGTEWYLRSWYAYPTGGWNYILRWKDESLGNLFADLAIEAGSGYMFSVGNVQNGSKGNDVKLLQRLLKSNGFKGKDGKNLTIDGECGTNTVYAIKTYQTKKGLSVDGCAGPATWKSILLR